MTKVNDTQRTILAAAGGRASGLVLPLPKSLKLSVAKAAPILQLMIDAGLLAERPALDGQAAWRTDQQLGKLTLLVTTEGLSAVGIASESMDAADRDTKRPARNARQKSSTAVAAATVQGLSAKPSRSTTAKPRTNPDTKLGTLIKALRSKKGATIKDLTDLTGWQAHSVRGAISGALKKKQGLDVTSEIIGPRGRIYRIAE